MKKILIFSIVFVVFVGASIYGYNVKDMKNPSFIYKKILYLESKNIFMAMLNIAMECKIDYLFSVVNNQKKTAIEKLKNRYFRASGNVEKMNILRKKLDKLNETDKTSETEYVDIFIQMDSQYKQFIIADELY